MAPPAKGHGGDLDPPPISDIRGAFRHLTLQGGIQRPHRPGHIRSLRQVEQTVPFTKTLRLSVIGSTENRPVR